MVSGNIWSNGFILFHLFMAIFLKYCDVCDLLELAESMIICGLLRINFFPVVCIPFACSTYKRWLKFPKKDIKNLPVQEDTTCYESRGTLPWSKENLVILLWCTLSELLKLCRTWLPGLLSGMWRATVFDPCGNRQNEVEVLLENAWCSDRHIIEYCLWVISSISFLFMSWA